MGKLIVPNSKPKDAPKPIPNTFFDLSSVSDETNEEWVNVEVGIGSKTAPGAAIMSAIEAGDEDIHVFLVASPYGDSHFDPDFPMVVLNMAKPHFFPHKRDPEAERPQTVTPTILLFHELGHAAQWITRRAWFMESSAKSNRAKEPYFVEIEKDNLERHERPMCIELGHPCRWHYDDIFNDEAEAQQCWDKRKTAALTILNVWRDRKAKRK